MKKLFALLAMVVLAVLFVVLVAVGVSLGRTVYDAVGGGLYGGVFGVLTFLGYSRVVDGVLAAITPAEKAK